MERSRTSYEDHLGLPGKTASDEGKLGTLDKTTCSDSQSVRSEESPALASWKLRPAELVRLLNSTPLGEVINERKLYRHRARAGDRFAEGRRIDIFRYAAWLRGMCERGSDKPASGSLSVRPIRELLENQSYRCALTGRALTPQSASLDHIVPVSRGGQHRIENAQILDKVVNRAKGTLTNEEFIQMCREVVAHADDQSGASFT